MSTQDHVTLTVRERQQLASMEDALESADPELAKVLKGTDEHRPRAGVRRQVQALGQSARRVGGTAAHRLGRLRSRQWAGPFVVLLGLALMLGEIAVLWASVLGAVTAAGGLLVCALALRDRWALRRLGKPATGEPLP